MHADQPDINHVAYDAGDLDAVSNPDAVFADQEEVPHDRENHILQRDRHSRREQAGKRADPSQSAHGGHYHHDDDDDPYDDPPQDQELMPAAMVLNVAERNIPPKMRNQQDKAHSDHQDRQAYQQALQRPF